MAPSDQKLRDIADQAERDLNTYSAKTGANKGSTSDEAGVDSRVENKFPGAEVRYDQDLSTNASYNKRIPPEEGGELDSHGRQTRGEHFEGAGGPEHKLRQQERDFGGEDQLDATGKRQPTHEYSGQDTTVPYAHDGRDPLRQGREAVQSNLGSRNTGENQRRAQFKGADYEPAENVPSDKFAEFSHEGYVPEGENVQASRETDRF